MFDEIKKGIYFGMGFILVIGVLLGIVYAVGFHSAEEILSGTFSGNFVFDDNVTFNGNVNGIVSGKFANELIYSVPGSYSWTVPFGVTEIRVRVAAGGGGGSAISNDGGFAGGISGEESNVSLNSFLITAYGGQGGVILDSIQAGRVHQGGSGGQVIIGGGGFGGLPPSIDVAGIGTGQGGSNGGLVINSSSVSQGDVISIVVGAGGSGGNGGSSYGIGSDGTDGYVIIEY